MKMKMALDIGRGIELAALLRTGMILDEQTFFKCSLGIIEQMVHEVIHCLSMGWRPSVNTIVLLSMELPEHDDRGVQEEIRVLACESLFFARIDLPIARAELVRAAAAQGVEETVLDAALAARETAALLERTVAWSKDVGLLRHRPTGLVRSAERCGT